MQPLPPQVHASPHPSVSAAGAASGANVALLPPPSLPPQPAAAAAPHSSLPPRPQPQPFDPETIGRWIFPTNQSERKYQFEISSVAVRHNTLVSLPTGLGKTLIASVVMYNFHRWFPSGRCLFLAPTKPLVHQQVHAVRRSVGLPLAAFAELTGHMKAEVRARAWREARMLFLTPQTLVNDLQNGICPAEEIVCVVVDEAHKASGNHAYTQAVQMLTIRSGGFRVLALSATPGQTLEKIQEVVTNLRITRLEARDETSIDVMGCLNARVQETLRLALEGDVAAARDAVGRVYSSTLRRLHGLIHETDITKLPRFMLVQAQQKYMAVRPEGVPLHVFYRNAASFSIAIMMGQAWELVSVYGCGSCLDFLMRYIGGGPSGEEDGGENDDEQDGEEEEEDGEEEEAAGRRGRGARGRGRGRGIGHGGRRGGAAAAARGEGGGGGGKADGKRPAASKGKKESGKLVTAQRNELFATTDFSNMAGLLQKCAKGDSHPKLAATVRLLQEHFAAHGENSRVMVFTTYRSAVSELLRWLDGVGGVRAVKFIGQSTEKGDDIDAGMKGMAQKEQRAVVKRFRSGEHNVLVATSIGEEGLDIGEVDLIICYDALGSATRTTQRYGRTGRKHDGRVVTLLTEGYEEVLHERGAERYKQMRKAIRNPGNHLQMCPPEVFYPTAGMVHEKRLLLPEVEEATPPSDQPKVRTKARMAVCVGGELPTAALELEPAQATAVERWGLQQWVETDEGEWPLLEPERWSFIHGAHCKPSGTRASIGRSRLLVDAVRRIQQPEGADDRSWPHPAAVPPLARPDADRGNGKSKRPTSSRQDPRLVERVCALARAGTAVREMDAILHDEGFKNSKGLPWQKKTDGKVLMRILDGQGVAVAPKPPPPLPATALSPRGERALAEDGDGAAGDLWGAALNQARSNALALGPARSREEEEEEAQEEDHGTVDGNDDGGFLSDDGMMGYDNNGFADFDDSLACSQGGGCEGGGDVSHADMDGMGVEGLISHAEVPTSQQQVPPAELPADMAAAPPPPAPPPVAPPASSAPASSAPASGTPGIAASRGPSSTACLCASLRHAWCAAAQSGRQGAAAEARSLFDSRTGRRAAWLSPPAAPSAATAAHPRRSAAATASSGHAVPCLPACG